MKPRTPEQIEHRRQALKQRVAAALRANPSLLNVARENLERWRYPDGSWGRHTPYMEQWVEAIQQGVERCCELLEDTSEETQPLRAAAPFSGVLTEEERQRCLEEWRAAS